MDKKKVMNKPEKGNWEKVAWEVKAHNNRLFADVYVLGYMSQSVTNKEDPIQKKFLCAVELLKPKLINFCVYKLTTVMRDFNESKLITRGLVLQNDVDAAFKGDLKSISKVFNAQAMFGMADDMAEWFNKYKALISLVEEFERNPSLGTFNALLTWVHSTGKLLRGASSEDAPVTEEFAKLLSNTPHPSEIVTYCSEYVKEEWGGRRDVPTPTAPAVNSPTCDSEHKTKPQPGGKMELSPFRSGKD